MKRHAVLLLIPLMLAACAKSRPSVDEAHAEAKTAYNEATTPERKVEIAREFLGQYPESEYTLDFLSPAVYYLVEPLAAPEQADALIVDLLDTIADPELRRDVLLERLRPLAALGRVDELTATVAQVAAVEDLSFSENSDVVEAALEADAWHLALDRAERGLAGANAETYRADYPDREFTDDDVRDAVGRRLASTLAAKGWALANLDRVDEGLQALSEASRHDTLQFTGESANRIDSYRGRILLRQGSYEDAVEALAPAALYGGDDEALAALGDAFEKLNGSRDGLDAFLWTTRLATARQVTDFTLPDYEGRPQTFSDIRAGGVTLLAFWFPT